MHAAQAAISPETLLAIMAAAAIAATLAALASRGGLLVPAVVLELLAGVAIGPHGLGVQVTQTALLFKDLGLGVLFFLAGYELDVRRIAGRPLRLGTLGWLTSVGLAYAIVAALRLAGMHLSILYVGSALATTAVGVLIPMLSDTGELHTRFGTYLIAAGAAGEFGPILLLTLVLSTDDPLHNGLLLTVFVVAALTVAVVAVRSSSRTLPLLARTLDDSSQLAVRWLLVLAFGLGMLARQLGLDVLLGGFAAGLAAREMLRTRPLEGLEAKLAAVGFGVFIPFFFVVSGMGLDTSAFFDATGLLRLGLFLVLMAAIRGAPALTLYRRDLDRRERRALALLTSTQLPLVLAITTIASASGAMPAPVVAALVGAAVLSTLVFPLLGLRLRQDAAGKLDAVAAPHATQDVASLGGQVHAGPGAGAAALAVDASAERESDTAIEG